MADVLPPVRKSARVLVALTLWVAPVLAQSPLRVLNGASYEEGFVARGSVATVFGQKLADESCCVNPTRPLPTSISGTSVTVRGADSRSVLAPLIFASDSQLIFVIPKEAALGEATVSVVRHGNVVGQGGISIESVAPGLFSMFNTGHGRPLGFWRQVNSRGNTSELLVSNGRYRLSDEFVEHYLVVEGTGMRNYSTSAFAIIDGVQVAASIGPPTGLLAGSLLLIDGGDEVTIGPLLPQSFTGRGEVEFSVVVDGKRSNSLTIGFADAPSPPPVVCTYSLSLTTATFPSRGGDGVFQVDAPGGCTWAAQLFGGWVTITSGHEGSGQGLVEYTVGANGGEQRSASISVEGRAVSIAQAAGGPLPKPLLLTEGVVNAATFEPGLVPGSLISVFGFNLSPNIEGTMLPNGATLFDGLSLSISGFLAPLLSISNYGGQEQINAQVPFQLEAGRPVDIELRTPAGSTLLVGYPVVHAQPGVFGVQVDETTRSAAAINASGALVSPTNPVPRGSVVALFMTGLGPIEPAVTTGELGPIPAPVTELDVVVRVGNAEAAVWFSGYAPGFLGLYQVNFEVPATAPTGREIPLEVVVGEATSPLSSIAIR